MNKQEIFNTVVGHLIKQNKQSANVNGTCLYRGPNNTKCAFGILIPDEVYKPYMEGSTSTSILVNQSKQNEIEEPLGISPDDYMFVRHLQRCHDNALTGKDLHLSRKSSPS